MTTAQTRVLEVDLTRADSEARTAPCVVSTEFPVDRGGYREILSHAPRAVDLSRAPLPLIEAHDNARVNVGLVDDLRLAGGKLRGTLRLGNSGRATELWQDIQAGIVRNLSVGYHWLAHKDRDDDVLVTRWMPFEVSLVAAPADPHAGIYRSNTTMPTENHEDQPERLSRSQRRALAAETEDTATAAANIRELSDYIAGRYPELSEHLRSLEADHLRCGRTFSDFQKEAWGIIQARKAREPAIGLPSELATGYGRRTYSLVNAIRAAIDPRFTGGGYELEVSQELGRVTNRRAQGVLVPLSLVGPRTRGMDSGNSSYLIPAEHLASEFIDVLRARSVLMRMGIRQLNGLQGDVSIPKKTGASTAYWVGENQAVTESTPGVGSVNLSPRTVGGLVTFSHRMVVQSSPDIEQLVRQDLADTIATAVDVAALNGSGAANEPLGLLSAGIGSDTYTTAPTFADVVAMEGRIATNSADAPNMAYLSTPALMATMKSTEVSSNTGQFIWTAGDNPGEGRVNGYRGFYSASVAANTLIFGNWADLLMGTWFVLNIQADPYGSNFAKGAVSVRALMDCDFAVRHAASFEEIHA